MNVSPNVKTIVLGISFLCITICFSHSDEIPEFHLLMQNDSMGIGWATDWDDHRTFGLTAAYFAGPLQLQLDYTALTARADMPADTIRTDLLEFTVHYGLPFSIADIPFTADFSAGLGLTGSMAGEVIQTAWHDILGIHRPVPDSYDNLWQAWPKAAVLSGPSINGSIFYYLLAGPALHLSTFSLHFKTGIGERIFRGQNEFTVLYNLPVYSYDSFLSGMTSQNEAGVWIGWNAQLSGFSIQNRFNPMSGILDYQIGFSTRSWSNKNKDMNTTRRLALGSFPDRLCLASSYTIGSKLPVFGEGSPDFRLRIQMQNGERIGSSAADPVIHLQNVTAGIECPLMLKLGEWQAGIVFYTGPGFRTEQIYIPVIQKAQIISETWGFCLEAEIALRIEWHTDLIKPSFYGIEIAAGTIQSLQGDPTALQSDYMIVIRAIVGVE